MGFKETEDGYINKLKSKLFGLLNEREKGREWEAFLDSILVELLGWEDDKKTINYYILCSKLSSLKFLRYEYFRKTIFDCIDILSKTR